LETPSSRICLGMPMKMGTGCHDLIQKLEIWCSRNALRLQIFDIKQILTTYCTTVIHKNYDCFISLKSNLFTNLFTDKILWFVVYNVYF
jgi:hypothetical protein